MNTVAVSAPSRKSFASPFFSPSARIRDVLSDLDQIPPIMVRTAALESGSSPPVLRVILERLARHVDVVHGDCYPTQRMLAGGRIDPSLRYHVDTVRRALVALERLGLVQRLRWRHAWAVYLQREPHRDLRCGAYLLTAWARRHSLQIRAGVERSPLSVWARSRRREEQRAEGHRKYAVSRQVARKLARDAGIDLDTIVAGIAASSPAQLRDRRARVMPGVVPAQSTVATVAPAASVEKSRYEPRAALVKTPSGEPENRLLAASTQGAEYVRRIAGAFMRPKQV